MKGRSGVWASQTLHGFACWLSPQGSNLRREIEVLFPWRPLLGCQEAGVVRGDASISVAQNQGRSGCSLAPGWNPGLGLQSMRRE